MRLTGSLTEWLLGYGDRLYWSRLIYLAYSPVNSSYVLPGSQWYLLIEPLKETRLSVVPFCAQMSGLR